MSTVDRGWRRFLRLSLRVGVCAFGIAPACVRTSTTPPPTSPPPGADAVCTRDAKLCPDGSAVGRTGPNCEFAPCPGGDGPVEEPPDTSGGGDPPPDPATPPGKVCTTDAKLCPDGSAVGRGGPNCEFAPCPK